MMTLETWRQDSQSHTDDKKKNYSKISDDDYTNEKNTTANEVYIFNGNERTRRQQSHTNHQGTIEINRLLALLNSQSASRGRRKEEKSD